MLPNLKRLQSAHRDPMANLKNRPQNVETITLRVILWLAAAMVWLVTRFSDPRMFGENAKNDNTDTVNVDSTRDRKPAKKRTKARPKKTSKANGQKTDRKDAKKAIPAAPVAVNSDGPDESINTSPHANQDVALAKDRLMEALKDLDTGLRQALDSTRPADQLPIDTAYDSSVPQDASPAETVA